MYCEVKITLELFSPNFPDKLGIKNMFVLSFHLVCWKRSFDPISEFQTTALNQGSVYTSTSIEPDKTVNKKIKKSKLVISMKYIVQVRIIYLSPALPNIIYRKLPITLDDTHAQLEKILFEEIFVFHTPFFQVYSCNKITTTWIQIYHQNWNGFFSNASHQIMI